MERVWSRSLFRTSYFDLHPYILLIDGNRVHQWCPAAWHEMLGTPGTRATPSLDLEIRFISMAEVSNTRDFTWFYQRKWWNLTSEIGISSANSANMMIFRHIKMELQHQKWSIWPAKMVIWPKMGLSQHGEIEPLLAALKTNIFHLETGTISIGRSSSRCVEVWKLASHTKI